jgi:uncharacterized protein
MSRPAGAVALADRALAPDVARGAMLLLIALANAHVWLFGHPLGVRGYPAGLTGADALVAGLQLVLVDGRAYPLFGLLFGYGITQLAARRAAVPDGGPLPPGGADVARIVRRRGAGMVAIGLLHGVLLWPGDIVGAYGLLALLLGGVLVRGAPGTLAGIALSGTVVSSLLLAGSALPPPGTAALSSAADPDALTALVTRIWEWGLLGLFLNAVAVVGAVALGAWAGRRRLLDEPERHRPLLRRLALGGLAAAVVGGAPVALAAAGVWTPSVPVLLVCGLLHTASGYAGGVGYAALFGLLATRSGARPGPVPAALRAVGQRSLSCYLAQSVAFGVLMPAWALGLGGRLGVAATALVAALVWLVVLLVAVASDRAGLRGPAEVVLRRLTYGAS